MSVCKFSKALEGAYGVAMNAPSRWVRPVARSNNSLQESELSSSSWNWSNRIPTLQYSESSICRITVGSLISELMTKSNAPSWLFELDGFAFTIFLRFFQKLGAFFSFTITDGLAA